ncbi:MAG: hypothetical protein ACYTFW_07845 [Planctomycetota bacterium]
MKRYLIPTVAVLVVLAVVLAAFGQQGRRGGQLSEEERAKMRERFQNMSEEEREKFRAEMRERYVRRGGFLNPEEQQKSIKAIEEQLAKLKAAQAPRFEGGFQDLSEEERTKVREKMRKFSQDRQNALQAIIAQVARLQGRRQPQAEGARYMIVNTSDLKPIQDAAVKEKAKETSQLLERLIARGSGRGFGGRRPGGERPQGGQRGGGRRSTGQ